MSARGEVFDWFPNFVVVGSSSLLISSALVMCDGIETTLENAWLLQGGRPALHFSCGGSPRRKSARGTIEPKDGQMPFHKKRIMPVRACRGAKKSPVVLWFYDLDAESEDCLSPPPHIPSLSPS
mmetsp:Transcript_2591/g.3945  ORF Transcript_2591/g.3945 Transcript_2591/m.3945 type:complete len:124 (+) Transcript_2591:960-1331(+)